jgi:multiple sugar transport system permease protein
MKVAMIAETRRLFSDKGRTTRRNLAWGLAFASPWIIGFLFFTLGPMVAALYYSFTEFNIFQPPAWVGLDNYKQMFLRDELFRLSLSNTVYLVFVGIPLIQLFALFAAVLLNLRVKGMAFYRTIYFLPAIMPAVAVSILWTWIFNPQLGVVNLVLDALHLPEPGWIADPHWSKPTLILLSIWQTGTITVVYLAGLQNVPRELYESAQLDGAGTWGQFWYVTLPIISPVILFNVIMGVIWAFQYFTNAYIVSQFSGGSGGALTGAPQGSLLFYSLNLYANAFYYFKMGYASALAWVLFVIILLVTLALLKLSSRWTYYEFSRR